MNEWKISPRTSERLYSSTEIGEQYGLSAYKLNKLLCKLGIFKEVEKDNKMYKYQHYILKDKKLGENCYFNINFKYDSYSNSETTNVTIKFNESGKAEIEKLLCHYGFISSNYLNIDDKKLEKSMPEGKYAISVRHPASLYNPSNKAPSMIYLSNRDSRRGSQFCKEYFFIEDADAKEIRNKIKNWGNRVGYKTGSYKIPTNNAVAAEILLWIDQYYNYLLYKSNNVIKLTEEEIKHNNQKCEELCK